MALTAGGLVVSLIALPAGLRIDAEGFVNNVAAALVLIGPGLFLSNVIVGRARSVRTAHHVAPQLELAVGLLAEAVDSGGHLCRLLKVDFPVARPDVGSVADIVEVAAALEATLAAVDRAIAEPGMEKSETVPFDDVPLVVPRFGLINRLIEGVNGQHPMPTTMVSAHAAVWWADTVGLTFCHRSSDTGRGLLERRQGLTKIADQTLPSANAGSASLEFGAVDLFDCLRGCVVQARALAGHVAREAPKLLLVDRT